MGEVFVREFGPEKRFPYDVDTDVGIRLLGRPALLRIQRKAEKLASITDRPSKDVFVELFGEEAVTGWWMRGDDSRPGLTVDGSPFPYSKENVRFLMSSSQEFFKFVDARAISAREFADVEAENSKNASGPTSGPEHNTQG